MLIPMAVSDSGGSRSEVRQQHRAIDYNIDAQITFRRGLGALTAEHAPFVSDVDMVYMSFQASAEGPACMCSLNRWTNGFARGLSKYQVPLEAAAFFGLKDVVRRGVG